MYSNKLKKKLHVNNSFENNKVQFIFFKLFNNICFQLIYCCISFEFFLRDIIMINLLLFDAWKLTIYLTFFLYTSCRQFIHIYVNIHIYIYIYIMYICTINFFILISKFVYIIVKKCLKNKKENIYLFINKKFFIYKFTNK